MKTPAAPCIRFFAGLLAIALAASSLTAAAALADLAQTPLASSSSNTVKPNVSFVLDVSGSMAWSHAPDEAQPFAGAFGYATAQCNSIFYQPAIKYVVPKNADGTDFANSSFSGAWKDGYNTGNGTVNLGTSFYAYDNTTSFGAGTDTAQPAYYYAYTGTVTDADFQNQSSQFYTECNTATNVKSTATITVTGSNSSSVTNVKVGTTTITSGSTSSSSTATTVASRLASVITQNGYSATSSGNVVTIQSTNTGSAGQTPAITKTGSMTFTPTVFVAVPFTKVTVSSSSGPGGTDERQNFANWFSYYRTRILMMKSGAGRAFSTIGSTYRVGFMTIYATPSNSTTDPSYLAINDFTTTQKNSWYSKFYALSPGGGTPLKTTVSTAGRNFAGKLGPDPMQYSCQQNFLILTTDGYWNAGSANAVKLDGSTAVGNQDNLPSPPLPPEQYDGGLAGSVNTLADATFYYYNTDLRTSALGNCTGSTGADVCTNNVPTTTTDPADWQHMTTFTLGLGTNGTVHYTTDYLKGTSSDYNDIKNGGTGLVWPTPVGDTLTTIDDLWHAAVNGHGQYFSAKNPDLLVSGLRTALAGVSAREAAGAAAATSNLEPVAGDNFAFVANYRTVKWDGDVQARTIDLVSGAISTTAVWSAQTTLDAATTATADSRTIYTFLGGSQVAFTPSSFTSAQKSAWFNTNTLSQFPGWNAVQQTAATSDSLINYLRGQRGGEEPGPTTGPTSTSPSLYRARDHVLGDIINGKPVYVKVPPFQYTENNYQTFKTSLASRLGNVFVAANDGMLHAFDSATGNERWAYVPSFVLPNLKQLADDGYPTSHQYFVDGSPVVSDVWNGSAWKTILVAGLNGGGKGYYAIDVTNPAVPVVLWEFSDTNLGFTYGNPVIGKLTDGTWVVVFSSGYNNVGDGVGRLYVVNAYTGALRFTVSTGVGTAATPSEIGKINGWTDNGLLDNTLQRVYAGDMLGNLWRFDINDQYPPSGKDAVLMAQFMIGSPAVAQPITTKPELGLLNNKPIVFVGTGRYLGTTDLTDTTQQSFYAIRDDLTGTGLGNARTNSTCPLVQQTITAINGTTRTTSNNVVDFTQKCGWYLDFNPGNASPGERVNVDPSLQLGVLAIATNVPENSVCTVGGSSWLYFLDYAKGTFVTGVTGNVASTKIGASIAVGTNTYRLPDGRVVTTVTTSDDQHPVFGDPDNNLSGAIGKRVLWRELLQ